MNGINPSPNQKTGGEGPVSGQEVLFTFTFNSPISLPADHYFFVPQVLLSSPTAGNFLWLSGQRPIVGQFAFSPDLQSWIRNANLAPDWLRMGTDIVGPPVTGGSAPTFNMAFSLEGVTVPSRLPLPSSRLDSAWWPRNASEGIITFPKGV